MKPFPWRATLLLSVFVAVSARLLNAPLANWSARRGQPRRAHVEALTTSRIWRYGGLFVVLAMLCAIFAEFQAIETASSATVRGCFPGGYTCERIYYTGPSKTFPTGNKVTHEEGEVTGQPDSDTPSSARACA